MITTKVNHHRGDILVTGSSYDSGRHLGFNTVLNNDYSYSGVSLDQVLTSQQIKSIEVVISSLVKCYLESKND